MGKLEVVKAFLIAQLKRRKRNRKFLIWVIIVPILLMGFLNLLWGGQGINANVAVVDYDESSLSKTTISLLETQDNLRIKKAEDLEKGVDLIDRGKVEAVFVIPEGFGSKLNNLTNNNTKDDETIRFKVYYAGGEQEELIRIVLKGITSDINQWLEDENKQEPIDVESHSISIRSWEYSDMLIPGGIIIVLIQLSIFSTSSNFSQMNESDIRKRLVSGSFSEFYSMLGMNISDALFTTLACIIALATGLILFEINIPLLYFFFLTILFFIASLTFAFLGYMIGVFSSDQISAQSVSSFFVFLIVLLAEANLFSNLFPEYIKRISLYTPVGHLMEGFKKLIFFDPTLVDISIVIAFVSFWLIVLIGISSIFGRNLVYKLVKY